MRLRSFYRPERGTPCNIFSSRPVSTTAGGQVAIQAEQAGENPDDLLNKHLKAPIPSIHVHNNKVTSDLGNLLQRMLAKDKNDRPGSMKKLLGELGSMRVFKPVNKLRTSENE